MLEYNGWMVIRESFSERNESDELFNKIELDLKNKIKMINSERLAEVCKLNVINCNLSLSITGLDNHKSKLWDDIIELVNWISKYAVGSYGLIHFYDDEDSSGLENQFQVLALKKGQISFEKDLFLSPCIPEIEEN